MPVSALKKLKASVHDRKSGKTSRQDAKPRPPQKRETPAQRANRLRQDTLLPEWQRRSKVGEIVDRRIGEDDPTMTPEDRMLKRFVAENQRSKRASAFNLEDDSDLEDGAELTHGGRPLNDLPDRGQFRARAASDSEEDDRDELFSRSKRPLEEAIEDAARRQERAEEDGEPARKRSKKEVMEEVIAKSKLHKHERQQAHEEDLDMRDELDKGLPDLMALLRGGKSSAPAADGLATLNSSAQQYDQRVRQMAQDKRAQPSERTKTDEEKAEEHAKHLQDLENQRLRRMRGESVPQDDGSDVEEEEESPEDEVDENGRDDAATFGFTSSKAPQEDPSSPPSGLDDEDDFLIEKDLIADSSDLGSDVDVDDNGVEDGLSEQDPIEGTQTVESRHDEDDDDFLKDVLTAETAKSTMERPPEAGASLAYTYPCPQSHEDLLEVFKNATYADVPTIIQRIRALYHTSLAAQNKAKLQAFATTLIDHIAYLPVHDQTAPISTVEAIIRHVHSMARAFPIDISNAFRRHVERIENLHTAPEQPSLPNAGDLSILTAIGSTFPTSDHFHQVVTPAITTIAHWLETLMLRAHAGTLSEAASLIGAYLVGLALKYQRLSRRLVPETLRFTAKAVLLTTEPATALQHIANAGALANRYEDSRGFPEAFAPDLLKALKRASTSSGHKLPPSPAAAQVEAVAKASHQTLKTQLARARLARRPLEEHHHRPLAIKTAQPQFEATFHPSKHYDEDRERAEAAKLRKEHRREKKAAVRELRRDAEFVGREKLAARKAADAAYADKFRRIIGGIEREEGAGRKAYERERDKEREKSRRARF